MRLIELLESADDYKIYKVERDESVHSPSFLEKVKVPYHTMVELFGEPTADEDPIADVAVQWGISVYYAERGSEAEKYNEPDIMDLTFSLTKYEPDDSEYEVYSRQGEWLLHGPNHSQWDARMLAKQILSNKIVAT